MKYLYTNFYVTSIPKRAYAFQFSFNFSWFHGNISYNKAKDLLEHQQDGTFLVRRSQSNHDWFVLAVKNSAYSRKVHQFLIRHVVGYIIEDIPFCNISKLVEVSFV